MASIIPAMGWPATASTTLSTAGKERATIPAPLSKVLDLVLPSGQGVQKPTRPMLLAQPHAGLLLLYWVAVTGAGLTSPSFCYVYYHPCSVELSQPCPVVSVPPLWLQLLELGLLSSLVMMSYLHLLGTVLSYQPGPVPD